MPERDLYKILGISRDANDTDIKKAYHKLVKELHPDRNQDDPSAGERFKEVNAAHDILKDPQKRAAYDRFGHTAFNSGGAGRGRPDFENTFSDLFGDIFGEFMGPRTGRTGRTQRPTTQGKDLQYEITIDLEEACKGTKVKLRFTAPTRCEDCQATGSASGAQPVSCPSCGGTGYVQTQQGFLTTRHTCPSCRGAGQSISNPCRSCNGSGQASQARKLDITVPPGVDDGNQLHLQSEGAAGMRGGPPGDLYIMVRVREHPLFQRRGHDLMARLSVPITTAALGGEVHTQTIDGGETRVQIKAGTQNGERLRLRGKGMPEIHDGPRGDLYLYVHVPIPEKLTRRQKEVLEAFARETAEDDRPRGKKKK